MARSQFVNVKRTTKSDGNNNRGICRYRTVQCFQYLDGIPMAPTANETTCWEEMAMMAEDDVAVGSSHVQAMSETSCRNVACLAMFLDVSLAQPVRFSPH